MKCEHANTIIKIQSVQRNISSIITIGAWFFFLVAVQCLDAVYTNKSKLKKRMQYIILYVNNIRKKYGIEQWPAELPNMHTKTISIHRLGTPFMFDYRKKILLKLQAGP